MENELRLPLWWENTMHQVAWNESRVDEAAFRSYVDGFAKGNRAFDRDDLREGLWHRFEIRVNVDRDEPMVVGGPDYYEVITAEGLARGVGAVAEGGPLPPVR